MDASYPIRTGLCIELIGNDTLDLSSRRIIVFTRHYIHFRVLRLLLGGLHTLSLGVTPNCPGPLSQSGAHLYDPYAACQASGLNG